MIDDGLHEPHANFLTFSILFPLLNQSGFYVIEDVHYKQALLWKLYLRNLNLEFYIFDLTDERPEIEDNVMVLVVKD